MSWDGTEAERKAFADLNAKLADARKRTRVDALSEGAVMTAPITKALHEITAERDALRERVRDLESQVEALTDAREFACECPPPGCDCPGCSFARAESESLKTGNLTGASATATIRDSEKSP